MIEFTLALVLLLVVMAGMAVGVLMGRSPMKGSCGGMGAALGDPNYSCDICGGDANKCDEGPAAKVAKDGDSGLAYDAAKTRN